MEKIMEKIFTTEKIARDFARHEQNEKNYNTAKVFDIIATNHIKKNKQPIKASDLFAGAHPDRYNKLFKLLIETNGTIDWVDNSPTMIKIAKEYLKLCKDGRENVINFKKSDYVKYLKSVKDNSIDLILIKYSFDYIKNLKEFLSLLHKKMKHNGILISHLTNTTNILKSHSTNAKYFYKNKPILEDQEIKLKDGDKFTIKFFKESGNPKSGLILGAKTTKHYFSQETILNEAKKQGFKTFIGDWKKLDKKINSISI